ncbi:MAG TPA: hypothetical protein VKY85_21180 [Candidatus Angelobacter sp.]|nr:hypothetical protein [Candidatus Angelobacter sp.]
MRQTLAVWSILALCVCSSPAQTADSSDSPETVKALLQEVRDLKARVAALEAKQSQSEPHKEESQKQQQPESSPLASVQAATQPVSEPLGQSVNPEHQLGISPGIRMAGFGAVSYKVADAHPPEAGQVGFRNSAANSFAVGDVDLFLTSNFTSRIMVLSELVFSETSNQEFEVDVERFLLKYDFRNYLKLSFGRYHTATSYYNSVFHHGQWLQTAVDRPLVVEFADHGGLLPSQAAGVSMTGEVPSGQLGLNYVFEYGSSNTHRPNLLNPTVAEIEENNGQATTLGLFVKPEWLHGLQIGGSLYHDRINPTGIPFHIGQTIGSAHLVYVTPRFEFLNEAFLIRHQVQETGQDFNTPAFYSLISEKFAEKWRPFLRYQYVNSTGSPIFPDVGLRHGPTAGLRYDYNDYVALKVQYDRTFRRLLPTFNDLQMQLAFRF